MKKHALIILSLLMAGIFVLSSCSPAAVPSPTADLPLAFTATEEIAVPTVTEVVPTVTATATEPPPTPTPTPMPVLPCNVVFESDRDGNLEIYSMAPDGSNPVNLTNNPANDFDPVWSPDGTRIAFVSNRETESGGQFIYILSPAGRQVTQVSFEPESLFPDWSPLDGEIAYSSKGDVFLVDIDTGNEANLTRSPEHDEQPKISPDGQRIAWLKDVENSRQIFVMDLDGGNPMRVTNGGNVDSFDWTVDGRLFAVWSQPDGICFNCVVTADGKEVIDAGGKGTIQEFLPFWTLEDDRVEMGSGDINGTGREDIFLVGAMFPDVFKFLTSNAGNNRHPDTAFRCGPYYGANGPLDEAAETPSEGQKTSSDPQFVIGYTGSINPMMQKDFDQACSELDVECVHGKDIAELAGKGVDAIVNASNRWDVMGSYPQLYDAVSNDIPVFVLNAETSEPGAFNLSVDGDIYSNILSWMMKSMNEQGEFVYYNFGGSEYIQKMVDPWLKEFPGIIANKNEPTYDVNPFTGDAIQNMIGQNPNVGAIWSSEPSNDLFWAVADKANSHMPLIECPAREDMLIAWKNEIDAGSDLRCISYVRPGGTAYEGIYVAYYYLSGLQLNPEMLTGEGRNTLKYFAPEITNENLADWLLKLDSFRVGDNEMLLMQPMAPEQIKDTWFVE